MPAAIAYLASEAFWIAVGKAVLYVAIEMGLSALVQSMSGNKSQQVQGSHTRDVNMTGTTEYRQMIYGECVTAGYVDASRLIFVVTA